IGEGGMVGEGGGEGWEGARRGAARAAHDGVRVAMESLEQRPQQARPCNAAVVCPESPTQRFAAEPGAAAFIRDREAPAANAIVAALQLRPGDGAGPDHDHTAVPAAMRADTGRLRVRDDDGPAKRM